DVDQPVAERAPAPPSLASKLSRTRESLGSSLRAVFARGDLDRPFWEEMEEALIGADVGVEASQQIVGRVRESAPHDAAEARGALARELRRSLDGRDRDLILTGT